MINLKQIFSTFFNPASKDRKEYLDKLVRNLEEVQYSNLTIPFTIQEIRPKGFLIKTGGLFGFILFEHMPWNYSNQKNWQNITPYLIGQKFYCLIYSIKTNPIQILVDGKVHKFGSTDLEEGTPYNAIVIQKTSYGLFLEIGYNFSWKYGSIIGLAHITTFLDASEFENFKIGDTLTTYFHGYNTDKKPIFGYRVINIDFLTGKLQDFIGTIKEVTVKVATDNKREYLVEDKYPATLFVTKIIYPDDRKQIKNIVLNFQNNEKINCYIIGINTRRKTFELKLTEEYYRIKIG